MKYLKKDDLLFQESLETCQFDIEIYKLQESRKSLVLLTWLLLVCGLLNLFFVDPLTSLDVILLINFVMFSGFIHKYSSDIKLYLLAKSIHENNNNTQP